MKKQFFVVGVKDNITVSIAGPFSSFEAMEAEASKRKNKPDVRWSIVHESNMK